MIQSIPFPLPFLIRPIFFLQSRVAEQLPCLLTLLLFRDKGSFAKEELAFCNWTEDLVKETSLLNKEFIALFIQSLIERNALGFLLAGNTLSGQSSGHTGGRGKETLLSRR